MNITGIIPARFASTRFPGKPLIDIGGKSMIMRVYDQAKKSNSIKDVIVATDDTRIFDHVLQHGGKAVMTSSSHQSGTDRCGEVLSTLAVKPDVVFNIQGDEPFIHPEPLDLLAACFNESTTRIASLAKKITDTDVLMSPNVPKVILNHNSEAIYFSRAAIPHFRGKAEKEWTEAHTYFKHIGIYAYRSEILPQLAALKPSSLEIAESLEQLRWLENGYSIKMAITTQESVSIDVPEDLNKIKHLI